MLFCVIAGKIYIKLQNSNFSIIYCALLIYKKYSTLLLRRYCALASAHPAEQRFAGYKGVERIVECDSTERTAGYKRVERIVERHSTKLATKKR